MEKTYPKLVTLNDPKLENYLKEKSNLIMQGRSISEEIEDLEKAMQITDSEIQKSEKKVDISDIDDRAKQITKEFNLVIEKMEAVKKEMFDRVKTNVPVELYEKYESQKKTKEDKELERNKIGLKVQKYNDKIIPLGRKLMKPYLEDEFDDYDTLRIENGEIIASIFNHIHDFKDRFRKRN